MRRWKMPVTEFKRFVFVAAQTNNRFRFFFRIQIQMVNRIAAKNDDGIRVFRSVSYIQSRIFRRGNQSDRVANCAERNIHCVREQVNFNRLPLTGDNERIFSISEQIIGTVKRPLGFKVAIRRWHINTPGISPS